MLGLDPKKTIKFFRDMPRYYKDLRTLKAQKESTKIEFPFGKPYPILGEWSAKSGAAKGHYFHQDLLVARRIHFNNPTIHVDVGSRVDGFIAHVASFRTIEVFDIRPLSAEIPNITFKQADLMSPINEELVDYCDSLSCLHALEHFGLGRYGDPVRYDGHLIGLDNLWKILKKGGKFYFSVPIGPQRIEFNAHRVFSVSFLVDWFSDKYHIEHFSYVDDKGDLHENVVLKDAEIGNNYNCNYGCGIFEMSKL